MRSAIVLGARERSGNIGEAILQRLRGDGWNADGDDCMVQGPERPPGALQLGGTAKDYTRYDAPAVQSLREFDACVITLGTTHMEPFNEVREADIRKVLYGCLELPLMCARRYVQAREKLGGKIVFTGSYAYRHPFTNGTAYCAAKAGLDMAAKTLGWELTDKGFRVHIVHPFHVKGTPMWEQVEKGVMKTKGMTYKEADAYNRKDLKMPNLCTPEEVASVVAWLLEAPGADWLSGTSLELFGGSR